MPKTKSKINKSCEHNRWDSYSLIILQNRLGYIKGSNPKIYRIYDKDGKWKEVGESYKDEIDYSSRIGLTVKLQNNQKLIKELEAEIRRMEQRIKEHKQNCKPFSRLAKHDLHDTASKPESKITELKEPTRCLLWHKKKLESADLNANNFELIETFTDDSHFSRRLIRCKECGQLYFKEFYEEIDWISGNDPQYTTLIPVETDEDIEKLKKATLFELLLFSPRLQKDFPKEAIEPKVSWIGKQ